LGLVYFVFVYTEQCLMFLINIHSEISSYSFVIMASADFMTIFEFLAKINDTATCLEFLRENNLIVQTMICKKCSNVMKLSKKPLKVCSDGQQWTCGKCKTSLSIRDGSFFKVIKHVISCSIINDAFFKCRSYFLLKHLDISLKLVIMHKVIQLKKDMCHSQMQLIFC
jgi:hypothetical protein